MKRILASSLPPDFHGNFKSILSSPRPTKNDLPFSLLIGIFLSNNVSDHSLCVLLNVIFLLVMARMWRYLPFFPCLLGIIRHHIWLTRNKARFDKVMPHYPTVLSRVKSALRCVIRVQQRHCLPANFPDFWMASGVVLAFYPLGRLSFLRRPSFEINESKCFSAARRSPSFVANAVVCI